MRGMYVYMYARIDDCMCVLRAALLAVSAQIAEHHRDITIDGHVGDRHPQLHGPHDRVGNNSNRPTT